MRIGMLCVGLGLLLAAAGSHSQTSSEILADATKPATGFKKAYGQTGLKTAQLFQDSVDPYSGNVQAQMLTIAIPGNGGMNINVSLAYRMEGLLNTGSSRVSPDSTVMFDDSTLRAGPWSLGLAPKISFIALGAIDGSSTSSVCNPVSPAWGGYGFDQIFVEFADGRSERLFMTSTGVFETRSRWKLACETATSTQILQSPDGATFRLGIRNSVAVGGLSPEWAVAYLTTRATDRNGNYFDIAYTSVTALRCAYNTLNTTVPMFVPSSVTASDGRTVSFTYDAGTGNCANGSRGPRLTSMQGPGGANWSFEYYGGVLRSVPRIGVTTQYLLQGQLKRVVLPGGTAYAFEYTDICPTTNPNSSIQFQCGHQALSKVTLPTGGFIGYEYRTFFDATMEGYARRLECSGAHYAGCRWGSPPPDNLDGWNFDLQAASYVFAQPDLLRRFTSDGGNWVYAYDRAINKTAAPGTYDVTTINGPEGQTIHRFIGLGYFTPSGLAPYSRFANVCNPDESPAVPAAFCNATYPGGWQVGLPVDVQKGSNYLESFTWGSRTLTTVDRNDVYGRVWITDGLQVLVPQLQQHRIVLNGATYDTNYSNYDQYGNAQTISESGPNGGARTSTLTYYVNTTKWILNQVQNESFPGTSITRTFDTSGRLTQVTRNGVSTGYTYDSAGNIATATFPRTLQHTYSNYKRGIPQTEAQPESVNISRVVDDAGRVTSQTDGETHTTSFQYDGLGRLTRVTPTIGNPIVISYGTSSKRVERGTLIEDTAYDGFGRTSSVMLGGIATTFAYDALGRLTSQSNPGESIGTSFLYDQLHRVTRITNADGTFKQFAYAAASSTMTDELTRSTTRTYRSHGDPAQQFLMTVTPAANPAAAITIARDTNDLVTSVTQGTRSRTFGYDTRTYLTSETNPETGSTVYERDAAGNMTARTIGSLRTDYTYDNLNRLTVVNYPGTTPDVTQTWSKTSMLKTVGSSAASRVLGYDANDNLTGESLTVGTTVLAATYAYDANDQLASITYPVSGRIVSYAPDALGHPTQVSGYATAVTYWPSGRVRQVNYANGVISEFDQNSRLWLSALRTRRGSTYSLNSVYTYDDTGNTTGIVDAIDPANMNRTLGYDGLNRLTSAAGPWGSGTIGYDNAGNITSQSLGASFNLTYSYDVQNRMSGVSGSRTATYTYDGLGNVAGTGSASYTYNAVPNLLCANCSGSSRVDYIYDGLNKRVSATKSGTTTYEFYNSRGDLLVEYTPSQASKLVEHIYLSGQRIAQRRSDSSPPTSITPTATSVTVNNSGGAVLGVTIGGTTPSGTVSFSRAGSTLGTAYVSSAQASIEVTAAWVPGANSITAVYSGDVNNSGNSLTYSVNVIVPPPDVPASITVPASSLTGSYSINWGTASGWVTSYEVYEATNSSFTGQTAVYSGGTATSVALSSRGNGTYYYRVRACNSGGCGAYRAGANPTVVTLPPGIPSSITVPASSTTGSYTISWGTATGTLTAYELYEATNSGFTGAVVAYSGTGTSIVLSGRTKNTYFYRVRACNASACSGYRTGGNSISVTATPSQPPSISFPSTNSTGSYTVSWGASTGTITAYELWEGPGVGTGGAVVYSGTATSALISGKTDGAYYYRVRACNTSIDCSVFQSGGTPTTVRIAPGAPSSISVPSTSSTGNYQVNWGTATGTVTHYELYEATNPSFSGEVSVPAFQSFASIVGRNNGTYYYRVRACNTVNSCGGYAPGPNVITVTLPPALPTTPTNLRKSPTTGTGSVYTILWDASTGPISYYILEQSAASGAFTPFPQINHPTTSKGFNHSCGEYTYRVKACSASGTCSTYSNQTTKRVCNN